MRKLLFLALMSMLLWQCGGNPQPEAKQEMPAETGLQGKPVDYTVDGMTMKGYLAYDADKTGKRPGILVVHEWWGATEYVRERADMLAKLGYTALAVDMYGEGKIADHPDDAMKFATEVMQNIPAGEQRFREAMKLLKSQATVDTSKIGAIGYCFGGGVVLHMARAGMPLDAVVSFHGSIATQNPAKEGDVKAAILVCNGADDPFVTDEQIDAFKAEMEAAGADFKFVNYPGAVHSFTNPDADANGQKFEMPLAYNKAADEQSWQDMQDLFNRVFAE
ncbi:MAG: dienelactone hydrolase family protein [Calditrichaeota bacterium]|nr:dienelactone hydrolase family protein [Calditrichota bacterium]MCB0269765.1 dienelactone hydrolase family protein [Calditrichota bacterium]MCB0299681.1 dienelactone hydrolase family protein [Calditrichota bacterium]MCB9067129.1 dienelactone hydrolase family protein [Calditrichia bacterium]